MKVDWDKVSKITNVLLVVLLALGGWYTLVLSSEYHEKDIELTAIDAELQVANNKLGLAKSKLLTYQEIQALTKLDLDKMEKQFQELVEEHNLQIKSKDLTIAKLSNVTTGGTTTVETRVNKTNKEIISYSWKDSYGRFYLVDPDIHKHNNEVFKSKQHFSVRGFVFEAKDGQLQTRKVELKEVYQKNDKWTQVPGSTVEIVDSTFIYTNRFLEKRKGLLNVLVLRPYALFNSAAQPGLGLEILNLGRYIPALNLGIGPQISLDLSDPLAGTLQNSTLGLSAQYHLIPPLLDTNIALGVGIAAPFKNLNSPMLILSISFYLTPDLNPFQSWGNRPNIFGIQL